MKSFLKAVGVVTVFAMSQVVFAQTGNIAKIESGDIVQEDIHDFEIRMSSGFLVQPEKKSSRSTRVTIDSAGNRTYNFTGSGRLLWKTDKYFGKTELRNGPTSEPERIPYLPPSNVKLEDGAQWVVKPKGNNKECGDWYATWRAITRDGPETKLVIDGSEISLRTINITLNYDTKESNQGSCDPIIKITKDILYSPDLGEVISFQETRIRARNGEQYTSGYSVKTTSITKAKK